MTKAKSRSACDPCAICVRNGIINLLSLGIMKFTWSVNSFGAEGHERLNFYSLLFFYFNFFLV